jgi:hypothetical protein
MRNIEIDTSTREINYYNSLKTIIDNCAFEIEIGEDCLIRDKSVKLDMLYGVLTDGKIQLKIHKILNKRMLRKKHVVVSEFS